MAAAAASAPKRHIRLVMCHATGFCWQVWRPVLKHMKRLAPALTQDVVVFDFIGHGSRGHEDLPSLHWIDYIGDEVIQAAYRKPLPDNATVVCVGHSMGAAAVADAAACHPGAIDAAVLVEPICSDLIMFRHGETDPDTNDHPMSQRAKMRRATFPSLEVAREYFEGKSLFKTWTKEAFDGYLEGGLQQRADGQWHLTCRPETEAAVYRGTTPDGFNHLPSVRTPTLVLAGEHTTTRIVGLNEPCSTAESFKIIADRIPGSSFEVVPGSHFYPMEHPEHLAHKVVDYLRKVLKLPSSESKL